MEIVGLRLTQIVAAFKALSPAARWTAALSIAAALGSLTYLASHQFAVDGVYLMDGSSFSTTQLQHMEGAFGQAGLADYQIDGARIRVPRAQQAKYMASLAEAGALPADFGQYLQKAVNTNSFMLYGARQEAQLKVAVQSELQGLINNFQGIERSFVHIAEETSAGFPRTRTVTASVGVQPVAGQSLDERSVAAIRWIVASAWGGLKPENVTVVDLFSRRLFAGPVATDAPSMGAYADNKRQLELDWQEKIARALGIPGLIVTTNVELDERGQTARRVSASVAVPVEYFQYALRERGLPAGANADGLQLEAWTEFERQECQRIKQAILPLLCASETGVDAESLIAVSALRVPPPPAPPLDWQLLAVAWARQNWQLLGLAVLVVLVLLYLPVATRSKESPIANTQAELSESAVPLSLVTPDAPVSAEARVPAPHMPLDSRREELAELIRQDPQAAASVLRSWLGNAS